MNCECDHHPTSLHLTSIETALRSQKNQEFDFLAQEPNQATPTGNPNLPTLMAKAESDCWSNDQARDHDEPVASVCMVRKVV
ncbi:hypothetical protein KOR42_05160 [Thalassoglobus neptunius]|uniref:Uncharacterized protein n=1 Tax=Thalassoglobus neptunius TaxID=1938619 RepID=A0A5C5X2Y9_9PLAN|nr:hypothetical protein KOR42_05160 [Thalassoglobus neptunius]